MAIWYVDFEGEAGTGDGTSFANRARSIKALYNIASERDGGTNTSDGGSNGANSIACLLYTSPSPRDKSSSRMPSSA